MDSLITLLYIMYFALDKNDVGFPDPHLGEPDGFLAVGGGLTPEWLLTAYSYGIFPWYGFKECDEIQWWCPMQRFVIFPDEIHISHSMRQLMKKNAYYTTINEAFDDVICSCAMAHHRNELPGAWLGRDMIDAYRELYRLGYAFSVEVWENVGGDPDDDPLVGGLYGVNIGRNFFGESMFSLVPSASKLALIHLADVMKEDGGIIDCQFETPHLKSMGGRYISYDEYMEILNKE